jgi:hypothetical protein
MVARDRDQEVMEQEVASQGTEDQETMYREMVE